MVQAGIVGTLDGYYPFIRYLSIFFRFFITLSSLFIISYFCFSIDKDGEETPLDLVKDFTALLIIIDVDNIILGFADIKPDHIGFVSILSTSDDD